MLALGPSTNVKVVQIKSNLVFGKKRNHFFNELFDTAFLTLGVVKDFFV
jgi:hypothetical protein